MSDFDENFEKAMAATAGRQSKQDKKPVYKPAVKLVRYHWPPSAPADKKWAIKIDEITTDSMDERSAKEVLDVVRKWIRIVRTLGEVDAMRTILIVSDGVFVEYRPDAGGSSSLFPSDPLFESRDRSIRDNAARRLRTVALRVVQGTRHPDWRKVPHYLGGTLIT
jgi:hypothetical protein